MAFESWKEGRKEGGEGGGEGGRGVTAFTGSCAPFVFPAVSFNRPGTPQVRRCRPIVGTAVFFSLFVPFGHTITPLQRLIFLWKTDPLHTVCGLPPEYCEYGSTAAECRAWAQANCPEMFALEEALAGLEVGV